MSAPGFEFVAPADQQLERLRAASPVQPFAPDSVDFCAELSRRILADAGFRRFPEMVAFAFFTREAQLRRQHESFTARSSGVLLAPRGLAFHVAPGNVDTIFLYSLVLSLLAGNVNLVRLSRRRTDQVERVLGVLRATLDEPRFARVRERLGLVRYEHDEAITAQFSSTADVRVIWGGDATVRAIRAVPLPAHALELTFADKLSLAVLSPAAWLAAADPAALARAFVNDAYWFAQMACSSPRAVVWVGDAATTERARERFWPAVEAQLAAGADRGLGAIDFVNKLVAEQSMAADHHARVRPTSSNLVRVLEGIDLSAPPGELKVGAGLFADTRVDSLDGVTRFISRRTQTIATHGIPAEAWRDLVVRRQPRGLDRVVPLGEALSFAAVWDGFDLLRMFTREVSVLVP